MTAHVESYECEWAATLRQPERVARFRTYVNSGASVPGTSPTDDEEART